MKIYGEKKIYELYSRLRTGSPWNGRQLYKGNLQDYLYQTPQAPAKDCPSAVSRTSPTELAAREQAVKHIQSWQLTLIYGNSNASASPGQC